MHPQDVGGPGDALLNGRDASGSSSAESVRPATLNNYIPTTGQRVRGDR